jgi:hypothetical protein
MQGPGPPGWGLDPRLTTLLCKRILMGFEVLTAVIMKSSVFCDITPCTGS